MREAFLVEGASQLNQTVKILEAEQMERFRNRAEQAVWNTPRILPSRGMVEGCTKGGRCTG